MKRACRRTEDEVKIHEKAVKLRKMTDEQLVHYVEDRVAKAESEGYNQGVKEARSKAITKSVEEFLADIKAAPIPGVGAVTVNKLTRMAKEHGYIQ